MRAVLIRNPHPVKMFVFPRQYASIRQELLDAIEAVCSSQRFILGPQVARVEPAPPTACAVPHAVGCATRTDPLWLALAAANIGPGHATLTTPATLFATVSA